MCRANVLLSVIILTLVGLTGIGSPAQVAAPAPQGPTGLESIPAEYRTFFSGLGQGDVGVKAKMNLLMTMLGPNLVAYLSSNISATGPLGGEGMTGVMGLDGKFREGPKLRALSMGQIDEFLASPYFKFLSAQCAAGAVQKGSRKDRDALKRSGIIGTSDGTTFVVAGEQISIGYLFSNGYLAAIEIIK